MREPFTIAADKQRCLLRITFNGFFRLEDVRRYVEARNAAFRKLGCGPDTHLSLVDASDLTVQSQDVLAAFTAATNDTSFRAKRIAFVTGSSLARRQIERVADDNRSRWFSGERQAMEWLFN